MIPQRRIKCRAEQNPRNQQPQLQWTLPDGWQENTPSQMRVASFSVTGTNGEVADVGVIPLPASGQEIQLVNMWRDQLQLPAATNDTAEAVAIGSDSGKLFDIASDALLIDGKSRARILVAMMTSGGTSWFFKMTGEDSFVASQKPAFLQFLKSVNFVASTAAAPMPGTSLGNQNFLVPNANTTETGGTAPDAGKSIWTVPPDWKQIDPGPMLSAKFSITGNDGSAEVNILSSGMDSGLAANVNRWRGQLGLPPVAQEDEFSKMVSLIDVGGGKAQFVDLIGTDSKTGKPARLVGVIVPQNGQTWFYKLMGDDRTSSRGKKTLSFSSSSRQSIPMLLKRLIKIFTSLRLTVILLSFAILLVFIGTIAQVDEGLYQAQARYFRQWIILGLDMFGQKNSDHLARRLSHRHDAAGEPDLRAHLSFSTFKKKNRHHARAFGRHSAARRPAHDRHDGARNANAFCRGRNQVVFRKPAQLRTDFHERRRRERRAGRFHSRHRCSRAAGKLKMRACRSQSA